MKTKESSRVINNIVNKLLHKASTREQLILQLLHTTGITPKELVNIKRTDITNNKLTIPATNTKNKVERTIHLEKKLHTTLLQYAKKDQEYLFYTRQSTQLSTRRIEQLLKELCKKNNLPPLTPRDLRNNYKQTITTKTHTTKELQEIIGLKTITKQEPLDIKKLNKKLNKQPPQTQKLVHTILQTGYSLQKILSLKQEDLQQLPITTQLKKALTTKDNYLFSTRQSKHMSKRRAEQLLQQISLTSNMLRKQHQQGGGL